MKSKCIHNKKIKVVYRKLGKERVWGWSHSAGFIELDPRLKGKKHLEMILHECLHYLNPLDSENDIIKKSILIANTMWEDGYRKCDHDTSMPLQDLE